MPVLPADADDVSNWLSALRGSRVSLRVPQRGDKRALAETVTRNAAEALAQHRLKRASDLTARSSALSELGRTLGMDAAPLRIECIDISHVQGTDVVASLVVFEDGLPKRSDYRRFAIRDRPGDDVASIAEVVRRRFSWRRTRSCGRDRRRSGRDAPVTGRDRDRAEIPTGTPGIDPETGRPRRFAYPPQLLVVDGGAPQVNAAAAVLTELGHRRRHGLRPGQAAGGGLDAGRGRSGDLPADQRGPVPAAAAAGRGAPVRHHLPPAEALEVDDGVRAGHHPRPGHRPGARPCCGTSARWPRCAGPLPRRSPRCPASAGRRPRRSSRRSPPPAEPDRSAVPAGRETGASPRWVHPGLRWRRMTRCRSRPPRPPGHRRDRAGCQDRRRSSAILAAATTPGRRAGRHRGGDRLRSLRRRPVDRGEMPGGPRLVRGRQPAARADRHHGRPRRQGARRGHPDRGGPRRPVARVHRRPGRRDQGSGCPWLPAPGAVPGGHRRGR